MGSAANTSRSKKRSKNKGYKKSVLNVKVRTWVSRAFCYVSALSNALFLLFPQRRTKDIDQIQDEIAAIETGRKSVTEYLDPEAPGGGQFVCVPCGRYFINKDALTAHEKTKPHKKRVKEVQEPQWNQATADAAAGKSAAIK